jgi:CRP/FNR family cyclic AMP-dependent transcriptional regulator
MPLIGAHPRRATPRFAIDVAALKRVAVLAAVGDTKLAHLARACRHRSYDRGDTILDVGEAADGVYVLLAGRAKMVLADDAGRQMTLGLLEPNELFGQADVFDESPCVAGVTALSACETLYMPKRAFLDCIEGSFDAAIAILRTTLARLSRADRKIATLGLLDVHARVARLLVESAEQIDGQWIVNVGSEEIARSVAASREMVSRVVKKMAGAGLVRRHKRKTMILDLARMTGGAAGATR